MIKKLIGLLLITPLLAFAESETISESEQQATESETFSPSATENEKNPEDPTKIITKLGIGYNGDLTVSGSIGLDETRMINGSINADGSNWRVGGSWLLPKGILNFNVSGDEYRTSYSAGTYVPLHMLGVDTGEWMIFPMAGLTYIADKNSSYESYGGYAGLFALRPIDDKWTVVTWAGGGLASDDYTSYFAGAGLSYRITKRQSVNVLGSLSEDSYRTDNKVGINYRFEFN